ncbi:uncharacterized protein LOC121611917 [Scomber scombrus]|uniref:Uncharacterized protein LOC121611917 n=1 Tax=Scomber scombrus TaxID=13677 RepID=A0AAV1Q1N2_SCOSC
MKHNHSYRSMDCTTQLTKKLYEPKFSCARTKGEAIVNNVLAPWATDMLSNDVRWNFLYYVDPQAPSLEFVRNRDKIRQYLRELSKATLTKQTQQNYLKSLKRFLLYHTVNTNLRHHDPALYEDCEHFIEFLGSLQKCCSKQVSKEITRKRHSMLTEQHQLTPYDCLAVLRFCQGGLDGSYWEGLHGQKCNPGVDRVQLRGVLPPGSCDPKAPPAARRGGAHDCEYSYALFVCVVSKFHLTFLPFPILINVISLFCAGARVDSPKDRQVRQRDYWCEGAQDRRTASCHVCPVPGGGVCKFIIFPVRICQNLFKCHIVNVLFTGK